MTLLVHNNKIDFLKGVSIVGVLAIHTTGPAFLTLQFGAFWEQVLLVTINQIFRFSVPMFLFISAYLFAMRLGGKKFSYTKFLAGRIKRVFIPYLLWSLFYITLRYITEDPTVYTMGIWDLAIAILTGSAYGHLYFIPLIFQFYLLLPLALRFSQTTGQTTFYVAWFLTGFLLILLKYFLGLRFSGGVWAFLGKNFLVFWWLPFFAFGLLAGFRKGKGWLHDNTRSKFIIMTLLVILLTLMVSENLFYQGTYYELKQNGLRRIGNVESIATFLRPSAYCYALCFIVLTFSTLPQRLLGGGAGKFIINLGLNSYGIYLLHPLVQKILAKLSKLAGMSVYGHAAPTILLTAGTLFLSWLVVNASSRSFIGQWLWGAKPHIYSG